MTAKLPAAVWENAVQHQKNGKKDKKCKEHSEINDIFCDGSNQRKILTDVSVNQITEYQNRQSCNQKKGKNNTVKESEASQNDKIAGFLLTVYGIEPLYKGEKCL